MRTPKKLLWSVETGLLLISVPLLAFPTLKPWATVGLLLSSVLWWVVRWRIDGQLFPPSAFNGALLLWGLAVAIGVAVTAFPELTAPKATGLVLGLITYRYLILNISDLRRFQWAALAFVGLGLGLALVGALGINWRFKVPLLERLIIRLPPQLLELPGTSEAGINMNQLGGTLTLYVPFSLAMVWCWRRRRQHRFLLVLRLAVLGLFSGLLFLSQSRSAWIGGAVGCWGFLLLRNLSVDWRWKPYATIVLLIVPVLVIAGGLVWAGPAQLAAAWQGTGGIEAPGVGQISLSGRVEIWSRALYAAQDFPFTGCGLGTFREVVWILYPLFTVSPGTDIAHAHNIFLQVTVDAGFPGLIAYLALLGTAGGLGWRLASGDESTYCWLPLGLLSGLIALHIYGLTDALAPGSKPGLIFWFALGLLAVMEKWSGAEKADQDVS